MSSPSFQTQEKFLFVLRVSTRKLRMAFSYIDSLVQNVQRKGKENVTICLLFLAFFFQQSSIFLFFPLFESGIIGRQSKKSHSFAPQNCFWSVWKENGCPFVFLGACRVGVGRHQRINQKIRN